MLCTKKEEIAAAAAAVWIAQWQTQTQTVVTRCVPLQNRKVLSENDKNEIIWKNTQKKANTYKCT